MRSITGSQERGTEESVARSGCGEAEFGKSLLQMRREKNQHLFIHLDSSFTRAQTPTYLTQLQRVKERISLLFLTLHPSSLALSSAEAINQACALSLSLSFPLTLADNAAWSCQLGGIVDSMAVSAEKRITREHYVP